MSMRNVFAHAVALGGDVLEDAPNCPQQRQCLDGTIAGSSMYRARLPRGNRMFWRSINKVCD